MQQLRMIGDLLNRLLVGESLLLRSSGGQNQVVDVILLHGLHSRAGALEVLVNGAGEDRLIDIEDLLGGGLGLGAARGHGTLPLTTELLNLHLVVQGSIVVLALAGPALPDGQVLGVHGGAVVVSLAAGAEVLPAALLLAEIQTGGIGEEQVGNEGTEQTEPGHNVEALLSGGVGADDGDDQGTELTGGSRDTVSSTTDGGGEDLSGDQEGDTVGTELVEERGQEVHGLEGVNVLGLGVVVVLEAGNDEEDEAHHETDDLSPLATVELVIDGPHSAVVTGHLDTDVGEGPEPAGHDGVILGDDLDEVALEELVTVEENIVGEPSTSGGNETRSEVPEGQLERLGVVSGDGSLLLLGLELLAGGAHVVCTVVDEPQSTGSGDGERNTVGPLSGSGGESSRVTTVEDQQQEDKNGLVEELTPTLHGEGTDDATTTVKTILRGGDLAGSVSVLHTNGGSHRVLTTDTDGVEEQRPHVTDNPAVLGNTPRGSKHDQTDEHDDSILNETPATTDTIISISELSANIISMGDLLRITKVTNEQLTDNDTDNFHVADSGDPVGIASLAALPAVLVGDVEQTGDVTDGEEDVTKVDLLASVSPQIKSAGYSPFQTQTSTGQDKVAEVVGDGRQGIILDHGPEPGGLLGHLLAVLLQTEADTLTDGQIGPVATIGGVAVGGADDLIEGSLLMDLHLLEVVENFLRGLHCEMDVEPKWVRSKGLLVRWWFEGKERHGREKKRRSRSLHIYLTERRARSRARAMQREGGKKTQQGARQREPRGGSRVNPRAYRMHVREHDSR